MYEFLWWLFDKWLAGRAQAFEEGGWPRWPILNWLRTRIWHRLRPPRKPEDDERTDKKV